MKYVYSLSFVDGGAWKIRSRRSQYFNSNLCEFTIKWAFLLVGRHEIYTGILPNPEMFFCITFLRYVFWSLDIFLEKLALYHFLFCANFFFLYRCPSLSVFVFFFTQIWKVIVALLYNPLIELSTTPVWV